MVNLNGRESDWKNENQSTNTVLILASTFFVKLYSNDIDDNFMNYILKFANDTVIKIDSAIPVWYLTSFQPKNTTYLRHNS